VVTAFESVVPALTWTGLCTRAFGAGVHTVTDGLVVLSAQGAAAYAGSTDAMAKAANKQKRYAQRLFAFMMKSG